MTRIFPASRFSDFGLGPTDPDSSLTVHCMACRDASSRGSPLTLSSIRTREWQEASTSWAGAGSLVIGWRLSTCFVLFLEAPLHTPTATSSSVVSVPVLSKRQQPTRPATGTLNGSVQKICIFMSVMRLWLTANAICIGSSGGITLVRMRMQCSSSSYLDRPSVSIPLTSTYPEERSAKTNNKSRSNAVSRSCPLDWSVCPPSIMRTSFPWEERKPVRRTKAGAPPSGGRRNARPEPPSSPSALSSLLSFFLICIILVPP
mmetsp:Transcript_42449/g.83416  ORF Transcript_42449/g.83416 Transcript_42449/m.83416 type:complete len:260 (+) Transcript_42449:2523-3302(+)